MSEARPLGWASFATEPLLARELLTRCGFALSLKNNRLGVAVIDFDLRDFFPAICFAR
jgi:hypothetical protein